MVKDDVEQLIQMTARMYCRMNSPTKLEHEKGIGYFIACVAQYKKAVNEDLNNPLLTEMEADLNEFLKSAEDATSTPSDATVLEEMREGSPKTVATR
jgi:hypothetical protein